MNEEIEATTRKWGLRNRTDLNLDQISEIFNPVLRGWIEYYGRYCRSELNLVFKHFNSTIVAWLMRKYDKFKGHKIQAGKFLRSIALRNPNLFAHWKIGILGVFA